MWENSSDHSIAAPQALAATSLALGRLLNSKELSQFRFEPGLNLHGWILDYVCFEKNVVVELAVAAPCAATHCAAAERRVFLSQQGFLRVAVTRKEILGVPDKVTAKVLHAAQEVSRPYRCQL
jgi:very-short-patch-repair endonuclease